MCLVQAVEGVKASLASQLESSNAKLTAHRTLAGVNARTLGLRAMLCGHRGAQCAFSRQPGSDSWRMYSSSTLHMGVLEWPAVLAQCRMKTLQPTVLLYDCER